MGEEWEVAGKKKKKIEKIKEEPKAIIQKEEPKKINNDISKTTFTNKLNNKETKKEQKMEEKKEKEEKKRKD